MTGVVMALALLLGAVVQALFPAWRWLGYAPAPMLLAVVLYYALHHPRPAMLWAAMLGGLIQDALGLIPLGYSSFCFVVAGLAVATFRDVVFVHEALTHLLVGALASGGVTSALYVLLAREELVVLPPAGLALKVLGSVLLGALIVPLVFGLMETVDRLLGNVEEEEYP